MNKVFLVPRPVGQSVLGRRLVVGDRPIGQLQMESDSVLRDVEMDLKVTVPPVDRIPSGSRNARLGRKGSS